MTDVYIGGRVPCFAPTGPTPLWSVVEGDEAGGDVEERP